MDVRQAVETLRQTLADVLLASQARSPGSRPLHLQHAILCEESLIRSRSWALKPSPAQGRGDRECKRHNARSDGLGDRCSAFARHPDPPILDISFQAPAAAVLQVEGVEVVE